MGLSMAYVVPFENVPLVMNCQVSFISPHTSNLFLFGEPSFLFGTLVLLFSVTHQESIYKDNLADNSQAYKVGVTEQSLGLASAQACED